MSQPSQLSVEIDLLYDLAREALTRFMPGVFNCACEGKDDSCARILRNDPRVWERREAVEQIANWLQTQAMQRETQQHETERELQRQEHAARWAI